MFKKIGSLCAAVLVLSACGTKNNHSNEKPMIGTPPQTSTFHEHNDTITSRNRELHAGILGQYKLNYEYNFDTIDNRQGHQTRINLPNVEAVMHPRFSSDDKVNAYLSDKGAEISARGAIPEGKIIPGLLSVGARIPSTKLKVLIHTPAYEREVLESDLVSIQDTYKGVFNLATGLKSLVIVPLWKDTSQTKTMSNQLYKLLFEEALAAAKSNSNLEITLFASNRDQADLMDQAWETLNEELSIQHKELVGHSAGNSHHSGPALNALATADSTQLHQGSFDINGVAASIGDIRLMGVLADGNVNQRQSLLMVGLPLGQHMIAFGTQLGFENFAFNYSITQLWGLLKVTDTFKLSAGIGATQEKIQTFRSLTNRYGAMMELAAHYSDTLSDSLKVSIDAGVRGLFSDTFEAGWFGLMSLDNGSLKTSAFVSSKDFGLNFGIEQ